MRILLVVLAASLLSGCPQKSSEPAAKAEPEKVDNAATRYVGGLQNDVERAKKAAAAATEAIKAREDEALKQPDQQ
ncbi:MAG: hypothetical protein AAB262_02935 [Elusimicrobiota bacterium]